MDDRLLLAKTITLLYRESEDNCAGKKKFGSDSTVLAKTVIDHVNKKNETILMQDFNGKDPLVDLRGTLNHILSHNNSERPIDKTDLMQRLIMDSDSDTVLLEALKIGIEPSMTPEERGSFCASLRAQICDAMDQHAANRIFKAAIYALKNGRVPVSELIVQIGNQMDKIKRSANDGFRKTRGYEEIDISNQESLMSVFSAIKDVAKGEMGLMTGMQHFNAFAGPIKKFIRGETHLIPAKSFGYKSGTMTALVRQFMAHNFPVLIDDTKKPIMVYWSLENEPRQIFVAMYKAIHFLEQGTPAPCDEEIEELDFINYVQSYLGRSGFGLKVIRTTPSTTTYATIMEAMDAFKAEGCEVFLLGIDYIEKMSTAGCDAKTLGHDYKDLVSRLRNYCSVEKILLLSPWQFNGDARMVIETQRNPIRKLAGSGIYYRASKDIYLEIDVEIVCNITTVNGKTYLEYCLGKNRNNGGIPEANKYVCYELCPHTGLRDDVDQPVPTGTKKPPGASLEFAGLDF